MRKDILFLLALLLITLVWFKDVIFSGYLFCFGDIPRYYYPLREFAGEIVRNGHIPLWNPYIFCGNPLLATLQTQIFYPLSIITYILPMDKAFNLYTVAHIYLGGVFTYILLKSWGKTGYASFIAAVIYSFSGFLISSIHMNTTLSSVIWLPLIIFFYEKLLAKKSFFYAVITGIFLGVQFLGGEPVPLTYTVYLLFFYSIWHIWTKRKEEGRRVSIRVIVLFFSACIIAFLLTAVQSFPFLEFIRLTTKNNASTFENVAKWSLQPKELLNYFIPFTFGNISKPGEAFGSQLWLTTHYMGLISLLFAGIAVCGRKDKRTIFWLVVTAVSLLIAFGKYTPFFPMFYKILPLVKYNRYPVKYLSLTIFCISILAGLGFNKLITRDLNGKITVRALLIINVLIGCLVVAATVWWKDVFTLILRHYYADGIDSWKLEKLSEVATKDLIYIYQGMILFFSGTFMIILWMKYKNIRAGLFTVLFAAVILADVASANKEIGRIAPAKKILGETENIRFIKKDSGLFRIHRSRVMDDFNNVVYGADYSQGLEDRKDSLTSNTILRYRIFDTGGYDSIVREDLQNIIVFINSQASLDDIKLLNMLNVKYLVTASPVNAVGYKLLVNKLLNPGNVCISENENTLSRAFFADGHKVIKNRKEVLTYICKKEFDPKKEAVVEEEPKSVQRMADSVQCIEERADITAYKPGEIIIDAAVSRPKFLVLSESWYPGWKVLVDGRETKLHRADYMLMGVWLDSGGHSIKFVYDPFSFKLGAAISLLTVVFIVVIGIKGTGIKGTQHLIRN